jgi:hypothetical protein
MTPEKPTTGKGSKIDEANREEFDRKLREFQEAYAEEKEAASRASLLEEELRDMGATGEDLNA